MKTRLAAAAAVLLCLATDAAAHRLDEFLQATTIAVEKDHLLVQIILTPGVAVARAVLADIDTDGDEVISDGEQRAYVERVRLEVAVTLDGERRQLQLVSARFPTIGELNEGMGSIVVTFKVDVPGGGSERRLTFENHYRSGMAAYLVNCLSPDDPAIRISAQNRNYEQSFYEVDYRQIDATPNLPHVVPGQTAGRAVDQPGFPAWPGTAIATVIVTSLSAVIGVGLCWHWWQPTSSAKSATFQNH